jgi:hypothetical protein
LALNGIELELKDQRLHKQKYSNHGVINYKDALADLQIDLSLAILNEEKWTVAKPSD